MKYKNNVITKNNKLDSDAYSEEVQDIVEKMPTYWAKYFVCILVSLILLVLILSCFISYPDTVSGKMIITNGTYPIRIISSVNSSIHLLVNNRDSVKKDEILAYFETGVCFNDLLTIDSLLNQISMDFEREVSLPLFVVLGDLGSSYRDFKMSYNQYFRQKNEKIYDNMRQGLRMQIEIGKRLCDNIENQNKFQSIITDRYRDRLYKDSIIWEKGGLSYSDLQESHNRLLSQKNSLIVTKSSLFQQELQNSSNALEIQRLYMEERALLQKQYSDMISSFNVIYSSISAWKQKYFLVSPVSGTVEYLDFWHENSFIESGKEVFSIIQHSGDLVGEVYVSAIGAGKIKEGQLANIKIDKFPYDEYGILKGKVLSMSRMSSTNTSDKNQIGTYLVKVEFTEGNISNYGKKLSLEVESTALVEIVTENKRLIHRLFDNLKSKMEK